MTEIMERRKQFEKDLMENVPKEVRNYIETISKHICIFRNNGQTKAEEQYKNLLRGVIRCLDVQRIISQAKGRRMWEYYANFKSW